MNVVMIYFYSKRLRFALSFNNVKKVNKKPLFAIGFWSPTDVKKARRNYIHELPEVLKRRYRVD